MSSGYLELFIEQGETFSADITLNSINGLSYNLASYSAKSDIKKSYWSANSSASFDVSIHANTETIVMSLDAETTQQLPAGRYVYDLFITHITSNTRSKILEGPIDVGPSATKI